ncbi:nuclear transport factor 2 family protein [Gilvibacter sediminis]|uniref:nuclear transport factor 2 family protein n=1 Tax=Gilvibacter TaxID=379070 RepID=UPI002350794E|nr:nuclear transport factor 2 family protein [Gilvibacter sediminis]MDC7997008.1 nuclear transport factor 2 family protein [Gilvibacter sediminis]
MTTEQIANNLVDWCNAGDFERCYTELYSPDIVSIEPHGENPVSEGMEAVAKKGEWWEQNFEVHAFKAEPAVVADNWFSVKMSLDTTFKPTGDRSQSSQIAVYRVADNKIVKEQFFYDGM